ncbi:MAG: DUF859 family phage minor structural protein [Pseudoramibacter sp.]
MASGSISGNTNNKYIICQLNWQSGANTDGNYSEVYAQLHYRRTNNYTTSGTISGTINIDGTNFNYSGSTSIGSGWVQVASAYKRVYHNSDGTRSIWIGASGGISGTSFGSTSCGSSVTLDTIPRASQPSINTWPNSTPGITAGTSCYIHMNRKGDFTHTVRFAFGSESGTIATGVVDNCQWTPPLSLAKQMPNTASKTGTVYVDTYSGSTQIGTKSTDFVLSLPDSIKPSLTTPTLTDSTKAYSVLNAYAANFSKVTVATIASVYKDDDFTDTATISSVAANYNGQNYDASSGSFTFVPSTTSTSDMIITVTDSRGRTATQMVSIPVVTYTRPTVAISASRYADSAGTTTDDTGAYAKVTAACTLDTTDVADNSATVTLKYQEVDGTDWDTVDMGTITAGSTLSAVIPASDTKAYTLIATISDKIATTGATMALSNGAVPMDFLKGGKGIAVGKTSEKEGLEIGWHVFGQGFLDSVYPVGAIYISMNATSPAKLFGGSWERIYNRFLWAGAEWKTLSTSVSDTNTYTFTELTAARFGDPASNQWAYFDIPAGSYTRAQAVHLLNGLDPAYGVVKTLQVIDPSGTPEVGTTFGEATHTLTIDEMPSHSHTAGSYDGFKIKNDFFQTSGGSVPHNVIGVINNGQNNYESGLSTNILTNTTGGGKSHNNMPPALIANMWKRVS